MMKLTEEERKYFPGTDAYHYSESCREAAVKHNQNPMSMSMTIEYVIKYMPELIIDTPLLIPEMFIKIFLELLRSVDVRLGLYAVRVIL